MGLVNPAWSVTVMPLWIIHVQQEAPQTYHDAHAMKDIMVTDQCVLCAKHAAPKLQL